jgi:hypothetical protein
MALCRDDALRHLGRNVAGHIDWARHVVALGVEVIADQDVNRSELLE